jgi:hypothetical protein
MLCSQRPAVASLQKCMVSPKKRIASSSYRPRDSAVLGGCARSDHCANKSRALTKPDCSQSRLRRVNKTPSSMALLQRCLHAMPLA